MWRAKLTRMMDELPDKYLEPKPLEAQDKLLLPPDSKPVSQITEEEKRLYGVAHQLDDIMALDEEAHEALHQENKDYPPELCEKFDCDMEHRQHELTIVAGVLLMSLEERLGHENYYVIDGDDVYAVPFPAQASPPMVMPLGPMSES